MTVQELIDELNKVKDKSKTVGIYSPSFGGSYDDIVVVTEDEDGVYVQDQE